MAAGSPNVWTQMNYVPPRGPCNHKASYLSSTCACLRFMLHPLKSSSSYECDGCGHHASFHSMENKAEDEICKRWKQEAKDQAEVEEKVQPRSKKRPRAIEYNGASESILEDNEQELMWEGTPRTAKGIQKSTLATRRAPTMRKASGRTSGTRAAGKVTEVSGEDDIVELD